MRKQLLAVLSIALAGGVFVLDQWTKIFFSHEHPIDIVPRILATTTHHNFGLLANTPAPRMWIIAVTSLMCACLVALWIRAIMQQRTQDVLAYACILGGALGNLIDRITLGYVFDWILVANTSILNIADIAVGAGLLALVISPRHHSSVDIQTK